MQKIDFYYLKSVNLQQNTLLMHDLKTNFDKILTIVHKTLTDQLTDEGNLQNYPNKPNLPDAHIIALSLTQEALSIDSERWFWSKIEHDYGQHFSDLPHRTRYNYRRKRMADWIEHLASLWANALKSRKEAFIVDSIPVPVAHAAREHTTKVCRKHFRTAPDKGYSAVFQQYYIGYKLHLVISLDGVYHSMDMTKASMHDVHYLKNIKSSGLQNCLLLADKGYLSASQQTDLFHSEGIKLQTPKRRNQSDYEPWPKAFKTARSRIETVFSQLCDHLMLKRNYAKTFVGLRARIISKIASFTLLQYINSQNDRPINHVKHALAS